MTEYIDSEKVLELSKRYEVKLIRVSEPWHVFTKDGEIFLMPIYDGKVYIGYFQRFKRWLEEE